MSPKKCHLQSYARTCPALGVLEAMSAVDAIKLSIHSSSVVGYQ